MSKRFITTALAVISTFALQESLAADDVKTLPLASALHLAQAALVVCKGNGYNVTVTIMDPDYAIRLVLRADGANARTVEIARRKAYTVIKTGMSSGEFGRSVAPAAPPAQNAAPRAPG